MACQKVCKQDRNDTKVKVVSETLSIPTSFSHYCAVQSNKDVGMGLSILHLSPIEALSPVNIILY